MIAGAVRVLAVHNLQEVPVMERVVVWTEAAPALDPQAIAKLREIDPAGRHGLVDRVLEVYQTLLAGHLDDLDSATPDAERLARLAHTLKSSSATVGALAFSERCAALEYAVRGERRMPSRADLDVLIREGRNVLAAVGAMLAK
jgi:HPt (histidine-containing phosphotransfer) domain-containing protein